MAKSIVKNAAYKLLLSLFNILLPILVGTYANRVLGPQLIGRIAFVESIYFYFYIFATFGIYQYGLREVSRVRDDATKLGNLFSSLFTLGIIANLIFVTIYIVFITIKYKTSAAYPVFLIYSINMMIHIFYVEWANEGLEKYDFITIKTIIVRVIYVILLFSLVKSSNNFITYVLIATLILFINYGTSFIYIKRNLRFSFKNISMKPHIKYLFFSVILANASVLYTQLDRFVLGQYINESTVAFYFMAQTIMSMVNAIMLSVIYVTVPRLSNYLGKNDETTYISLLEKVSKTYFAFLFPAAAGIYVLANEIIILYGGSQFSSAIPLLKVFSLFMITAGIESILTNQIIYVKRKENRLVYFILAGGLVNLFLKIALVKLGRLSSMSAISTTIIANCIYVGLEYTYIKLRLKLNISFFKFDKLKYLLIALIFIPLTALLRHYISSVILMAVIGVFANSIVYLVILLLIKDEIVYIFLNKIKGKLNIKKRL